MKAGCSGTTSFALATMSKQSSSVYRTPTTGTVSPDYTPNSTSVDSAASNHVTATQFKTSESVNIIGGKHGYFGEDLSINTQPGQVVRLPPRNPHARAFLQQNCAETNVMDSVITEAGRKVTIIGSGTVVAPEASSNGFGSEITRQVQEALIAAGIKQGSISSPSDNVTREVFYDKTSTRIVQQTINSSEMPIEVQNALRGLPDFSKNSALITKADSSSK